MTRNTEPGTGTSLKVLVLARHFPPAISGGARRPYMWVKGFQSVGADVFVVAPELPDDVVGIAVEHPNPDPTTVLPRTKGLRDIAREWLLWPDPDVRWVQRAWRLAIETCPFQPDLIFTTSPPESIHVSGAPLKAHWPSAKWAIDARDHWLIRAFRPERRKPVRRMLETRIAPRILREVDAVFAVNEAISEEYRGFQPNALHAVVPHFLHAVKQVHAFPDETIDIVHTGSFILSDPDVRIDPLLDIFADIARETPQLVLNLVGRLRDDETARVEGFGLGDQVRIHGTVPLEQSLAMQRGADALAVIAAPNSAVPPGKMAEYRSSGRPVIPFGSGAWLGKIDDDTRTAGERLRALTRGETLAVHDQIAPATPEEIAGRALQTLFPDAGLFDRD
ncbi:glycosyltransferase family 4 protein [Maricaulis sp. MIT060901]|uniref:glycosyltransferase family 4 protein n=1 Tax=Maricaulis sp. MIT060901 TaxID=3096993 RepID=UPI003999C0C4